MTDVLERIVARKRDEVAAGKRARPHAGLMREASATSAGRRDFTAALAAAASAGRWGLIAEIKRRSPSHGLIRSAFDPASLARAYESGGATCLSILTDGPDFGGSLEDLAAARAATALPALRKDFIVDAWQLAESAAAGADCVLVIVAALDPAHARDLIDAALALRLGVLVEVHDERELEFALGTRARLIGINNRDLRTLAVDPLRTARLAPLVPEDRRAVAASGLATHADLARLAAIGVTSFLVGEALMSQPDVAAATARLLWG